MSRRVVHTEFIKLAFNDTFTVSVVELRPVRNISKIVFKNFCGLDAHQNPGQSYANEICFLRSPLGQNNVIGCFKVNGDPNSQECVIELANSISPSGATTFQLEPVKTTLSGTPPDLLYVSLQVEYWAYVDY